MVEIFILDALYCFARFLIIFYFIEDETGEENEDEESEDGEEEDFDDHWEIEEHMINDMSKNGVSAESESASGKDFANQFLSKYVKGVAATSAVDQEKAPRQFLKKKTSVCMRKTRLYILLTSSLHPFLTRLCANHRIL